MSRYYVISPNVENDGNIQDYLEQMFQTHTIMMGWSPQEHKGKMFDECKLETMLFVPVERTKISRSFLQEWFLLKTHMTGLILES